MIINVSTKKSPKTSINSAAPSIKSDLSKVLAVAANMANKGSEKTFIEKANALVVSITRPEALKYQLDRLAVASSSLWSPNFKEVVMPQLNKILW